MSYVQEELGAIDASPCTQDPSDPVCQAFNTTQAGTSSITGLPFSSIPSSPGVIGPTSSRALQSNMLPKLLLVGGAAVVAFMLLKPRANPRRRYRRRR